MKRISPREVARRRIITEFECSNGKGKLVANGKTFALKFDDLVDLAQAIEMIMLKLTGKLLRPQFRPEVRDRRVLGFTRLVGGGYDLYDGPSGEQPLPPTTMCDVTGECVKTHYLLVEAQGNRWDNWFGRLDELAKCLYIIVREAQGDPYTPKPAVFVGAHGPVMVQEPGHG